MASDQKPDWDDKFDNALMWIGATLVAGAIVLGAALILIQIGRWILG